MITLDGSLGITTPGLTNTGTETIVNLTTTGNTILGDASTDTLNVGNGGLVKDASGNLGIGIASPLYKLDVAGDINCTGSIIRQAQYTATFPGAYATVVDLTTIGKGLIIYGYAMENAINTSTGIWLATGNGTTYTLTLVSQSVIGSGHGTIQLQMSNNGLQIRNALSSALGNYKLSFVVLA